MKNLGRLKRSFTEVRPPDKWLKYVLLDQFGLSSMEYLRKTIRRYSWENRFDAIRDLREELFALNCATDNKFFVVKFVPLRFQFMLPNFRVWKHEDVEMLEDRLKKSERGLYSELWFCRTDVTPNQFSVAGRILIDIRSGLECQNIEQVWRCSPRLIETYNADFQYEYVRAIRPEWTWRPNIAYCHLIKNGNRSKNEVCGEFFRSMGLINRLLPRIRLFCDYLEQVGNDVYSLEYKIESSSVQIIDWDTQKDRRVLDDWFGTPS